MSIDQQFQTNPHLKRFILIGWIDKEYSEFRSESDILESLIAEQQPAQNQIQSCIQQKEYHQCMMNSFAEQYRFEVQIHQNG